MTKEGESDKISHKNLSINGKNLGATQRGQNLPKTGKRSCARGENGVGKTHLACRGERSDEVFENQEIQNRERSETNGRPHRIERVERYYELKEKKGRSPFVDRLMNEELKRKGIWPVSRGGDCKG